MVVLKVLNRLFVHVILTIYLIKDVAASKPKIFSSESAPSIGLGKSITIRCEGDEPLDWTPEEYNLACINSSFPTSTMKKTETIPVSKYKYSLELTLTNVTTAHVRFYYCHAKNASYKDEERSSEIYLFVPDPNSLSVFNPHDNETVCVLETMVHRDVIIPCRPTSPDVRVELYDSGHLIQVDQEVSFGKVIQFKSTIGFLVDHIYSVMNTPIECRFYNPDNKEERRFIYVEVAPFLNELHPPTITDLNHGHNNYGDTIRLTCNIESQDISADIKWILPKNKPPTNRHDIVINDVSDRIYSSSLTIYNVTEQDEGNYTCLIKTQFPDIYSEESVFIKIYGEEENHLILKEENNLYYFEIKAGSEIFTWTVFVDSHPPANITWFNNKSELIMDNDKFSLQNIKTGTQSWETLSINNIHIEDRGRYTIQANNGKKVQNVTVFLNVTDKPTVQLEMNDFYLINEEVFIKCEVGAYPEPEIYWIYQSCFDDKCPKKNMTGQRYKTLGLVVTSYFNLTITQSGIVTCEAHNKDGSDSVTKKFFATDVVNGFNAWHSDDDKENSANNKFLKVATDEQLSLSCAASAQEYTGDLYWYKGPKFTLIGNDSRYTLKRSQTKHSYRVDLAIHGTQYTDTGAYICRANKISDNQQLFASKNITITVSAPQKPKIFSRLLNNTIFKMAYSPSLEMDCPVSGLPQPVITWYKDDVHMKEFVDGKRIILEDQGKYLKFITTNPSDEGKYECKASNKVGTAAKYVQLKFTNYSAPSPIIYISMGVLFTVLLIISAIAFLKWRNEKKLKASLKLAGLDNFEKGDLECLNPELGIDDQAELLPYDKRFEFPREKLKLGKQLGSGAFGVVMKADAHGIIDGEDKTTVAVKMVKRNADNTFIRALASELKIMVHLGSHLNVVNLLGACTKNVEKRELLVIVEYCRFGNLHNYLLRHRDNYINQIDEQTGYIDYTIGQEILERSFSVSTNRSNSHSSNVKYAALKFNPSDSGGHISKEMQDYRGNPSCTGMTNCTDTTAVCMTPTGDEYLITLSNNSQQPEWRSNYRGDYKGNVKPICTKDLITWAFQVARGMEYLASRKVLHGDLAARNILLADNNIVKICDFGLAKSIYKNDNYKKKGDGPLPVKWMAIESIRDRVFSTQSDVWSFGIVLWELFSLARTPYPGMEANEQLYYKLVEGYRMDSPQYATRKLYQMMLECWESKPLIRPSFTQLAENLGGMLEESVKQHYIDLNDPYLVMNTQKIDDGNDYLAMCSPPDFENLVTPHKYVNDLQFPDQLELSEPSGYMCMKPSLIFSPREHEDDDVFTYETKRSPKNSECVQTQELMPMLRTTSSECESPTPLLLTGPLAVSNPTYHIPPNVSNGEIKTADNYVNMPENKSAIASDKNVNDKIIEQKGGTNEYINNTSRDWERITT